LAATVYIFLGLRWVELGRVGLGEEIHLNRASIYIYIYLLLGLGWVGLGEEIQLNRASIYILYIYTCSVKMNFLTQPNPWNICMYLLY
jgi:hypothetical protein